MNWSAKSTLNALETSGLVQRTQPEPDLEYLFRHALVQEAAYSSVLRTDRKALHALVGNTLEALHAERPHEFAAILGHHFAEAGESAKAAHYLQLAGESAARQYALREAIGHFSHLLELKPHAETHSARGRVYATLGDFDHARADFETALAELRARQDAQGECSVLFELGALWAGRDYQKTGEYYQAAHTIAVKSANLAMQANALNRIGNWYVNLDRPNDAAECHHQALVIFKQGKDERGIAETHDLLGMTNAIAGNLESSVENYQKAIALFRQMGEVQLLSSSLAALQLASPSIQTETLVCPNSLRDSLSMGREALALARAAHWSSGEAFALFGMGNIATYCGEYSLAWECIQESMSIAQSIQHDQWITACHFDVGDWYYSLLDFSRAALAFEQACKIGKRLGSLHWQRAASGMLASTYIRLGRLEEAQSLLDENTPLDTPILSLGQRLGWFARADLLLAQKQHDPAFRLLAQIEKATPRISQPGAIAIRLEMTRALAQTQAGQWNQAEATLHSTRAYLQASEALPQLWRCHALLATVYRHNKRPTKAKSAIAQARQVLEALLVKIPQSARDEFASRPEVAAILNSS